MAKTLTISCLKPGAGAFLVDGGRPGHQQLGVAFGGPADERAMAEANRLLGRDKRATCLEFTQNGGQWLVSGEGQFVLTGADMNWRLNGRLLEPYQVQYLEGDGILTSTVARSGFRSYLAVNGDWQTPKALGSGEAGLPGILAISTGWTTDVRWEQEAGFRMDLDVNQHLPELPLEVKTAPGPEWGQLSLREQRWLNETHFLIHPDSNRQGLRLLAESPLSVALPPMISSPVLPGTIQLAPSGPIILGPDAQTIGGYPRVLIIEDPEVLAVLFQVAIGEAVKFN